jgi:hypothetical protein
MPSSNMMGSKEQVHQDQEQVEEEQRVGNLSWS